MNYYEVVIEDDEGKSKYLVQSSSTAKAEKKALKEVEGIVISVKLTKYIDSI